MLDAYPEKTISPEQYCEQLSRGGKLSFIDLARQQEDLRPELEENIHKVLHHGRYIMGPEIRELEERLSDFAGVKYAVGCSSGTDALLMPLMAWNVGPGDAVFTTPFTFIATAEVISLIGATPVFVDIDPDTYNIDPFELRRIIDLVKREGSLTPRVIIPVDLFGLPADYDAIMEIAQAEGLLVLEDAAQSFGASYKGRKAGSLGHAAATSFFPAKPLGCYGDGGAVFTDDRELAAKLNSIRIHGKGTDKYENVRIGLNARLDTMQAAVLLPKLSVFPEEIRVRQRIAELYSEGLKDRVRVPHVPEDMVSAWAQYSVLAEGPEERSAMQTRLKAAGVPTAIYYPLPLHLQGAFSKLGYSREDFPVSEQISQRIFSLPMHPYLRDEEIEFIVGALKCR
ncbi:MAG TPA: DegT/DnrJ/EryC1/StrS family aminotransferase [Thermodesulfobacteriaceae bacterium]|nr:DegT/DnrJ/EryC1/StrS family aminotransferase [Thermodesulfobacteriaceae bacterium]